MNYASADTERCLIAALLKGGKVSSPLTASDFSYYTSIYSIIESLQQQKKTVDFTSVSAKVSDTTDIIDCVRSDGRAALTDSYAVTVHSLAQRRRMVECIRKAEAKLDDPTTEASDVVDCMRDELLSLQDCKADWQDMKSVMQNTIQIMRMQKGTKSSFLGTFNVAVDDIIGSFHGGEMTVIGARPAVGKSAYALHIAYNCAIHGASIGILSREMSDTQLGSRLLSKASGINGMKFRKGELTEDDIHDAEEAAQIISDLQLHFLFAVKNVEDLRRQVQARAEIAPLDMLIVDYLQLMDTCKNKPSEHLRIGEISRGLKEIALDYKIPVIALAQVNRDTDGLMPGLKNLKDSGSIEQDADNVIFLHKPTGADDSCIHPDDRASYTTWEQHGYDYIIVNVAKQRQGETGKAALLFDRAHMDYKDIRR